MTLVHIVESIVWTVGTCVPYNHLVSRLSGVKTCARISLDLVELYARTILQPKPRVVRVSEPLSTMHNVGCLSDIYQLGSMKTASPITN